MSLAAPPRDWFKAPTGFERSWIGIALVWCLILFMAMPYWHFRGRQNSTGEAYTVTASAFLDRTNAFVAAYKVGEDHGVAVVEPPPGSDVYMVAQMWRFWPILKLKKDQTYRVHLSSLDLNHGLSIQPMNMNFQVLPGYDHVLTITPTSTGIFPVICNEFCGVGHHSMTGRILVE